MMNEVHLLQDKSIDLGPPTGISKTSEQNHLACKVSKVISLMWIATAFYGTDEKSQS